MIPDTDEITLVEQANMLSKKCIDLEEKSKKLTKQKDQLRKMIDTAIGLAYDRDNDEAMDYLINEKDHYPELRD